VDERAVPRDPELDIRRLVQLGFHEHEIVRLVAYKEAVRTGYFSDHLQDVGSGVTGRLHAP
jgi:hypothetical protein